MRSEGLRSRVPERSKRCWLWKTGRRIARESVDLDSAQSALARKDEHTAELCLGPEDEVAKDVNPGWGFRPAWDLEVETRAAALASPSRRLCDLELA